MASAGPQAVALFATPVLTEMWDRAETLNPSLAAAIRDRRAGDPGVGLSNVLGWQSDTRMAEWGGEAARALLAHVVDRCEEVTLDLRRKAERRFEWQGEMWANVADRGASNQTHAHPGSYWSAVYYVDDGYAGSDGKDIGGELVFLDPRMPMVRMATPDLRYRRADGSHDHQETWIRPASGRLVMFPSWLMHSVRPYLGAGERLSIAINVSVRPKTGR